MYCEYSYFLLLLISNFIPFWSEKILCMVSEFIHLLKLVLWYNVLSVLKNISCTLEKTVYSDVVGWSVLYMSVQSSRFIVLFNSSISLLIFYLVVCPLKDVRYWSLQPLLLNYFSFQSCQFYFIYFGALLLVAYMFVIVISFDRLTF